MRKIKDIIQDSEEWHLLRKNHIGASDISVIMGINPWKTKYQLWLEKTGNKEEKKKQSLPMTRGKVLEATAREQYENQINRKMLPQVIIYDKWEVALASLDGISEDGELIVEIKCPSSPIFTVPDHYMAQVQWQLMVSKAKKAHLFWYIDEVINAYIEILPDEEKQREMLFCAGDFWKSVVEMIPPEIEERDYVYIDDPEFDKLSLKYISLNNQIRELDMEKESIKQKLIDKTDDGNTKGNFLSLSKRKGRGVIEWKKLAEELSISEETMKKYSKKSETFYWTINIKKERS